MKEGEFYAGARKKADGSMDLSQAAAYKPKEKKDEQSKLVSEKDKAKAEELFKAFERGGGSIEVQEAKLRVKDLTEQLERFKKSDIFDQETAEDLEKEIELNQRVVNGEKLVDVLDSMQSDEDKKRIEESRKRIAQMKQL